ncbi:MAG: protein tyrosine phosphatase [Planctomycetes bacterium]|nr:protein tyrosine phosphatase [Planctomycetota bacterium]
MRQIKPYPLWLGHAGDGRNARAIVNAGLQAVIDLAIEEPPAALTRELVYCRFPLIDGEGNAAWLLKAAIETTAGFLRSGIPTLICCGGGMSRSPAIAAAAIARQAGKSLDDTLEMIAESGPGDVSVTLWRDVKAVTGKRD